MHIRKCQFRNRVWVQAKMKNFGLGKRTWSPKCHYVLMSTSSNIEAKSKLLSLKTPLKVWLIWDRILDLCYSMQKF